MSQHKILWDLMFTFMKIGLFTFGGGYAMISLIENECVEKKKWITHDELMDITVIAESTPGPIAINCATYVGYQQAGYGGAFWATMGMIIPSFTVIYILSMFFIDILEIALIASAFKGIRIAVGVLILNVGLKMLGKMHKMRRPIIIMSCSLAVSLAIHFFKWRFSSIYLILLSGLTGYLIHLVSQRQGRTQEAGK